MFGSVAGQRFDAPFTTMIQELTANPLDSDGAYSGRWWRSAGRLASARFSTGSSSGYEARPGGGLVDVRPQHGQIGVPAEGHRAGQALVEQAAERVHIGAAVDRLALDLLGGGVVDRAHDLPGEGEVAAIGASWVRPKSSR